MTSHIVFKMIIYITQVGVIKGEQEAYIGISISNMGRRSNAPIEEKRKQDDATLQIIFDYVVNNVYPEHACKNQKANIRKQSKSYFAKSGQLYSLYYRHQRGQHHENNQLFSYVGWGSPIQTLFKAFSY